MEKKRIFGVNIGTCGYAHAYARALVCVCVCKRQRVLVFYQGNLLGWAEAEGSKLKDAARVSFDRDIRLLVGKTPTSYYGLF